MTSVVDSPSRPDAEQVAYVPEAAERGASRIGVVFRWTLSALAFALVLEATCRVEDWVMYRMPLASRYAAFEDLTVRDADGVHGRPNAQFEKYKLNSLGLRGPETSVAPAPGTVRVITVGASETFGLRESPGREYPRQLQDSLVARIDRGACGGEQMRAEVLNAAFAGMGLPTIEQDVRNRLRRLHPDVIFAYPAPTQYLEERIPVAAAPDSSARPGDPPIERALHLRALDRIREQVKLLIPEWAKAQLRALETQRANRGRDATWRFTSVPRDRLAQYDLDLRRLIGSIRGIGAEPVLATHANMFAGRRPIDRYMLIAWEKFYPRASGSTIVAFDSVARAATLRVAADSNVVVVDAATRLSSAPLSAFADFVHFTDVGASYMADVASDGVLAAARRIGRCGSDTSRVAAQR